jgi:hypothetical protein
MLFAHTLTRVIAGITIPDTPTITAAIAYARANNDDHTYNHVMRSWLVGQASISHLPANITHAIDLEAFAVAAILHDLGWSHNTAIISPDKRFEVDGANAARKFLAQQGETAWNEKRIQLVWDAIALHATTDIALHAHAMVALLSAGIATELFSPNVTVPLFGPEKVATTLEEWEEINKAFPREGLKGFLRDTLVGLCRDKPDGTYGNFVADYGETYHKDEGYSEVGRRGMDLMERETRE